MPTNAFQKAVQVELSMLVGQMPKYRDIRKSSKLQVKWMFWSWGPSIQQKQIHKVFTILENAKVSELGLRIQEKYDYPGPRLIVHIPPISPKGKELLKVLRILVKSYGTDIFRSKDLEKELKALFQQPKYRLLQFHQIRKVLETISSLNQHGKLVRK